MWARFGNPTVYVEPFFGSGAVLLAREDPCPREIIADTNGHLVNFWRALTAAPDEVAMWADWPTFHHDLTARHRWLIATAPERAELMRLDPEYYDAKAAGWWVWGISNWIGGGWGYVPHDKRPLVNDRGGGRGVQLQHIALSGVAAIGSGERLLPWFRSLAQRMAEVVQLDRDWRSALTPTLLMDTATSSATGPVAVFLDPPYLDNDRSLTLYTSDLDGEMPAAAAWQWALDHGDRYRVAYCCHADDFELPEGWDEVSYRMPARRKSVRHEVIRFSPACLDPAEDQPEQGVLL